MTDKKEMDMTTNEHKQLTLKIRKATEEVLSRAEEAVEKGAELEILRYAA